MYAGRETNVLGFVKNPKFLKVAELMARRHMRKQLPEPELRERVTPDYKIGCKRILPSNRWYPALREPNVELVTAGVKEVRPRSVVDEDGVEREVDAIIFGTGFHVADMPAGRKVRGARAARCRRSGRAALARTSGPRWRAFPTSSCCSGPTPGSGTARWCT